MPGQIVIENHPNNTTFGYSLIRLCGKTSLANGTLTIEHQPTRTKTSWSIRSSNFKALILLNDGKNTLQLSIPGQTVEYTFHYDPNLINTTDANSSLPRIRSVYFYMKNHDGSFNVPTPKEPHDLASGLKKQQIATLLMQTFCAEALGRNKTFSLEMDPNQNNMPKVYAMQSRTWTREAFKKLGNDWSDGGVAAWETLYQELQQLTDYREYLTFYCILAGSYYFPAKKSTAMAAALGGGQLAMFTETTFHSYPNTIDEIVPSWMDAKLVDTTKVADDSAYRATKWANFATGVGAAMHELGHSFGCPHTPDGIMSRGFDNFNRFFMISEPGDNTVITRKEEKGAFWERSSIEIILRHHSFTNGDCTKKQTSTVVNTAPSTSQIVSTKTTTQNYPPIDENSMMNVHYFVLGPDFIGSSSFEHLAIDDWLERHGKSPFCRFKETSRNAKEIILLDASRGMELKLTLNSCSWRKINAPTWNKLGVGKVLFPNRAQDMEIITAHGCKTK